MVAPSGEQHVIESSGYRAVVTECGAGLRELEYGGRPLVAGYPQDRHAAGGRGQLLLPWPNRVADGRYRFGGRDHQLGLTEVARGHASHGLVRWASWTADAVAPASVSLRYRLMAQPGYPWALDLTATYALSDTGLAVTVTAENLSSEPAPFAAGAHPYLTVDDGPVDGWDLELRASTALLVDERKIPVARDAVAGGELDFSRLRPVGTTVLDTAFTDLGRDAEGRATVTVRGPGGGVALWMDERHRWVQVFSADDLPEPRSALAVEPMTSPPNALATGDDLVVLGPAGSPDDSVALTWGIHALD